MTTGDLMDEFQAALDADLAADPILGGHDTDEAAELQRRLQKPGRGVVVIEPLRGPSFDATRDVVFEVDVGDDAAPGRVAAHLPCLRP